MRLVLFDIDGTLLHCGRQVRAIFRDALAEVCGVDCAVDGYDFRGRLDPRIAADLLAGSGLSPGQVRERLPQIEATYTRRLAERLRAEEMRLLPGVREVLAQLAGRGDVAVGLLTGNWRRGAVVKLGRFGLAELFAFGAYGEDGHDRADLPPIALERARLAVGRSFCPADAVIVGDSCEDVRCARAHGIPVLAVTTGWTSREELVAAGADRVAAGLAELPAFLA